MTFLFKLYVLACVRCLAVSSLLICSTVPSEAIDLNKAAPWVCGALDEIMKMDPTGAHRYSNECFLFKGKCIG